VTPAPLLAIALAASAQAAAPAAVPAAGGAVLIEAQDVRYSFKKREVRFTNRGGQVTLTRDDGRLSCDELVTRTDAAGKVESATCQGAVKFVRAERTLACTRAVFEAAADRIVCEGDAVLREGGTEARGARLVYELKADEVRFEGTPGKPVQITVPGEELDARKGELERRRKELRK